MTHKMMFLQMNQWGPLAFRPPFGRPRGGIPGGRFKVRRLKYEAEKPWRAWTDGLAASRGRWFKTQAEAFEWAHATSVAYQKARKQYVGSDVHYDL